jgi:hypothetical protein
MARRASPPRGSLLCKTLDECKFSFERLSKEIGKALKHRAGADMHFGFGAVRNS